MQTEYWSSLIVMGLLIAMVLLIACANVANLMTAQAAARQREMALRISIGAGHLRLVQLLCWKAHGSLRPRQREESLLGGQHRLSWREWPAADVQKLTIQAAEEAERFTPPLKADATSTIAAAIWKMHDDLSAHDTLLASELAEE